MPKGRDPTRDPTSREGGRRTNEREASIEASRGTGPSHTELNMRNKTRLEALGRRYPGKLELRAPQARGHAYN